MTLGNHLALVNKEKNDNALLKRWRVQAFFTDGCEGEADDEVEFA